MLDVFELMSLIKDSAVPFPAIFPFPISFKIVLLNFPTLESSSIEVCSFEDEERMLNNEDADAGDEGKAESAAEYWDKTRGSEKLAAAPAAAAAAANGSMPCGCGGVIVDCVTEDAFSLIEAEGVVLLIEGLVRFGNVKCGDAGFDSKLLINIELPNPDSKGDNAAPAPAAPNAAIAKAAY